MPEQAPVSDPRSTDAAVALASRDYVKVLALTRDDSSGASGAWLDYDRAAALTALGQTDEAVRTYARAEQRFHEYATAERGSDELWRRSRAQGFDMGQAASVWGRARALSLAGRCLEARAAYTEYAQIVRHKDPAAAAMAPPYSAACRAPLSLR